MIAFLFQCYINCLLTYLIFRSTQRSRPNKVGLKNVRPSVHKTFFFDFNEIWYVDRDRRVMHDGMQYDPI